MKVVPVRQLQRRSLGIVTCLVLALGAGTGVAQTRTPAAPRRVVDPRKAHNESIRVGQKFAYLLERKRMPWQFYQQYANSFYDYARAVARVEVSDAAAQVRRQAWVTHYRSLGDTLIAMSKPKREMDEIGLGSSAIPAADRPAALRQAEQAHAKLLASFRSELVRVPKTGQK